MDPWAGDVKGRFSAFGLLRRGIAGKAWPRQFAHHDAKPSAALDFDDQVFPEGRAARTAVAGIATEIVRMVGALLLATSRSYGGYLTEALISATGTP